MFDVTNLVVGAIIGADIYVASSFGAGYLGPLSLLVWVAAGIIAIVIALCFAQCAAYVPKVGGSYAYVKAVGGSFAGFMVGWSLWLAEWISLAVFPVAFVRYLMFFAPDLTMPQQVAVKILFVAFLAVSNIIGVKSAGRVNDLLTIVKLAPLIFFSVVGLAIITLNPALTQANFTPFAPFGFSNFGAALILIFWAYAGFELSTIPADEIKDSTRTIPRAIVLGIAIVTVFYLVTNLVLFGVRSWKLLATDSAPLAAANSAMLSFVPGLALLGGLIVSVGALVSVAGSDESAMIGTSRLGYALALDGLFPRQFAEVHKRFKTPYLGIIIQSVTALAAAILGTLGGLIATSVLFLSIAYFGTCVSIYFFRKRLPKPKFVLRGGLAIPVMGAIFSLYLLSQCSLEQFEIGAALLALGVIVYWRFSPGEELKEIREAYLSQDSVLERLYDQEERFLAHLLRHIKRLYRRLTGKEQAWS